MYCSRAYNNDVIAGSACIVNLGIVDGCGCRVLTPNSHPEELMHQSERKKHRKDILFLFSLFVPHVQPGLDSVS